MLRKLMWPGLHAYLGTVATTVDETMDPIAEKLVPAGPRLGRRPQTTSRANPFLVIGIAFAVGVVLAKWIDWRTHAHTRD